MKSFHQTHAGELTPEALQQEISSKGYVLVRGLLPKDAVTSVLNDVTRVLSAAGWLLQNHDPAERMANIDAACGDPDPAFKRVYQQVFNLESFHALPHHHALRRVMKMIVGEQVFVHPKPIGRLIFPRCEQLVVHPHQDYEFMGGDAECFTCGFLYMTARFVWDLSGFLKGLIVLEFKSMTEKICEFLKSPRAWRQEMNGLVAMWERAMC